MEAPPIGFGQGWWEWYGKAFVAYRQGHWFAKFGGLYLNKGWEGNQIVSREWVEQSTFRSV
jgi:hypothetical protein